MQRDRSMHAPLPVRLAGMAWLAAGLWALGSCSGCQKSLFPQDAPRTQFERYDTLRGGSTPAEEPDVFGRPQPALRARLTPDTN